MASSWSAAGRCLPGRHRADARRRDARRGPWDGRAATVRLPYHGTSALRGAVVDPDDTVLLDENLDEQPRQRGRRRSLQGRGASSRGSRTGQKPPRPRALRRDASSSARRLRCDVIRARRRPGAVLAAVGVGGPTGAPRRMVRSRPSRAARTASTRPGTCRSSRRAASSSLTSCGTPRRRAGRCSPWWSSSWWSRASAASSPPPRCWRARVHRPGQTVPPPARRARQGHGALPASLAVAVLTLAVQAAVLVCESPSRRPHPASPESWGSRQGTSWPSRSAAGCGLRGGDRHRARHRPRRDRAERSGGPGRRRHEPRRIPGPAARAHRVVCLAGARASIPSRSPARSRRSQPGRTPRHGRAPRDRRDSPARHRSSASPSVTSWMARALRAPG